MTDRVGKNAHLRLLSSENQNSVNRNSDSATEMFTEEEIPTELAAEMERFNVPPDVGKGLEALPTNKEEVRVISAGGRHVPLTIRVCQIADDRMGPLSTPYVPPQSRVLPLPYNRRLR